MMGHSPSDVEWTAAASCFFDELLRLFSTSRRRNSESLSLACCRVTCRNHRSSETILVRCLERNSTRFLALTFPVLPLPLATLSPEPLFLRHSSHSPKVS